METAVNSLRQEAERLCSKHGNSNVKQPVICYLCIYGCWLSHDLSSGSRPLTPLKLIEPNKWPPEDDFLVGNSHAGVTFSGCSQQSCSLGFCLCMALFSGDHLIRSRNCLQFMDLEDLHTETFLWMVHPNGDASCARPNHAQAAPLRFGSRADNDLDGSHLELFNQMIQATGSPRGAAGIVDSFFGYPGAKKPPFFRPKQLRMGSWGDFCQLICYPWSSHQVRQVSWDLNFPENNQRSTGFWLTRRPVRQHSRQLCSSAVRSWWVN